MADKTTMKAVVFDGPKKVSIQDRPIPKCECLCYWITTMLDI